eukprot:COSAG02_NODE_62_length_43372_cov_14.404710_30_plen_108_part_00
MVCFCVCVFFNVATHRTGCLPPRRATVRGACVPARVRPMLLASVRARGVSYVYGARAHARTQAGRVWRWSVLSRLSLRTAQRLGCGGTRESEQRRDGWKHCVCIEFE